MVFSYVPGPYRQKYDAGWFHGIFRGKEYSAVIDSAFVGAVGWTADGEVPFEEIVLERRREVGDRGEGRVSLTSNGWA